MNRKKKLYQIHQKRLKAAKAKGNAKNKVGYISKAERAKIEEAKDSEEVSVEQE
ncbi:DUF2986 domain-containing protein [Aliiglaciecola sp. LCG003]|uniref:DUF2986 domain-containing protein n=1 Tax=Aliiglaciecola sp. LCG003 TaxID=3053655 RepID=UPI0025735BD5|nr:DUF2986 domain-containing protein [Aliiglaciecola sp. LCG003]WJG11104.1 DUF2986 domain-containing protein [Aliiglaciecola sp. LCG003]